MMSRGMFRCAPLERPRLAVVENGAIVVICSGSLRSGMSQNAAEKGSTYSRRIREPDIFSVIWMRYERLNGFKDR
jgi:hypothetical protein